MDIFVSLPIRLDISEDWTGDDIIITASVLEDNVPLPPGDMGDHVDPEYTYAWTISAVNESPDKIVRADNIPTENTWTSYELSNGITFGYKGTPMSPPAYSGYIIQEVFLSITGEGLFEMDDLLDEWKTNNLSLMTENEVANYLFPPGFPSTFVIDANNKFYDTHSGFSNFDVVPNVFKPSAIDSKKAGYILHQEYKGCDGSFGTTEIWRRTDLSTYELKKIHSLL